MAKCKHCDSRTTSSTGFCQTCKYALRRGAKRSRIENLLIDKAGDAWWAWDRIGNIVAGPATTRTAVWIELGTHASYEPDFGDTASSPEVSAEAINLFERALERVESASIRKWATSAHNQPIWLQIAADAVAKGKTDPDWFAASMIIEAMGL